MKLYVIGLLLSSGKRKKYLCFAHSEKSAKDKVLHHFDSKYKQVINKPTVKLVRLIKEIEIKEGIVK